MLGMNPWVKMWTSPRKTIESVVTHNPRHRFNVLCFIYGFAWLLSMAQTLLLGNYYSSGTILVISLLLAIPVGYILISISSFFFYICGKLFKGKSDYLNVRASVAWSNIPSIVTILSWFVLVAVYDREIFITSRPDTVATFGVADGVMIAQLVLGIWSLVLLIGSYAQVEGFSVLRSIGSLVLVSCLWIAVTFVVFFLLSLAAGSSQVATMMMSTLL